MIIPFHIKTDTDNLLANNVAYDHLQLKYKDSVELSAIYYSKAETIKVSTTGVAPIAGNLNVGFGASSSKNDVHCSQQGDTAVTELNSQSPWISKLEIITTHPTPRFFISLKGSIYFEFNSSSQTIIHEIVSK